jgi:hypothetical protein
MDTQQDVQPHRFETPHGKPWREMMQNDDSAPITAKRAIPS